jgi:hypothetical protein
MISLGRKLGDGPGMAISIMKGDDMEDKEHFPSVYVDAGEELDKCKLGEMVTLRGKVTSKRVSENDEDDEKRVCLDIEVHELEPYEEEDKDEEEDEPKNHTEAVKKGLKKAEKEKENDDEY